MRELFDHHPRAGHLDVRNLGYWCLHENCGHAVAPRVAATPNRILGGRSAGAIRLRAIANGSIGWMEPTMWCSLSAPGFRTATSQRIWSNSQSRICCCPCWLAAAIRASVGASSAFAIGACPSAQRTRVAVAVRRSLGFVCRHTAINMLAWLLYPQSVYDRHISRRDCWPPASTSRSAGTPDSTAATCCRPPKGSFEIFSREGESK
jgi:hypothetical protein